MRKKLYCILIVTLLTISFVACGTDNSQNEVETKVEKEIETNNNTEETIEPEKKEVEVKYYKEENIIPTADTFLGVETEIVLVLEEDGEYTYSLGSDKEEALDVYKLYVAKLMTLDGIEVVDLGNNMYTLKKDSKEIAVFGTATENEEYLLFIGFI